MSARKPARVVMWTPRPGQTPKRPYLFWTDFSVFPPRQKRVLCAELGAETTEARAALVKQYRAVELKHNFALMTGGRLEEPDAYGHALESELDAYEADLALRVAARGAAKGVRVGMAESSVARIGPTLRRFRQWLALSPGVKCGDLTPNHLAAFVRWLATEFPSRSPHTLNLDIRNLSGALTWIAGLRPLRFRDSQWLLAGLKPVSAQAPEPEAFDADQIQHFYSVAMQRNQAVAELFRFYACTGCRRGEATNLTWADIDLERGRITFRAQKTGRARVLPLVGAPEGDIAPGLLAWLRSRPARNSRETVFSHFPEKAWNNVAALASPIMPQALRSNFTSYAASLGIPATVCALWQGHSAQVAERYYRAQILARKESATLEGAMGFVVSDTL